MFKILSKEEFDALTPAQQNYYIEQKKEHDAKEAQKTIDSAKDAAKEAVKEVKEGLEKTIEAKNDEIKSIKVRLDEQDKLIEAQKAENNRIRIAAEQNEKKGRTFDVALDEAMKENEAELRKLATDKDAKIRIQLKAVGTMGISSIADIDMANAQLSPGIRPLPNRRIHMRDIMSTGRMTTSDYHYLRETGGEGDVGTWTENSGDKAQLDLDYIEKVAPSQFIAGWLQISRKALDDVPALRSALASRLLEKYLIKEDQQILSGDGISPNLEGILQVADAYDGSKTRLIEKLIDAIGQLEENEYYADGIILKPRDWSAIATTVGDDDTFTLPGLGIVTMSNGILYVGGVPVYKMNGMPSNNRQFLVGDWMLGAQLLIREQPVVEFSYENGTNFQKNQITVRVEGRAALPIYYDEAFVKGSTGATT